jgi:hypothetical protein
MPQVHRARYLSLEILDFAAQIENEYGNIDAAYGEAGKRYMRWAASMAESLNTGVPWIMCQQSDAPSFIVHHTPVSLSSTSKNMM